MLHSDSRIQAGVTTSRYQPLLRIASGGMGSVYLATQRGGAGFRRIVAIKRAFPHLLEDPAFRRLLAIEARLASLVRHPNVVGITDVEEVDGEPILVMDYVEGASLAELLKSSNKIPLPIAIRIILDAAAGLEAVHTCTDEEGKPLSLVHRDVSPQNVLVGVDGVARIADFGIAQIHGRTSPTMSGLLRGKPSYMSPEYVESGVATPACDVFALGVVAWETFTHERLFKGSTDVDTLNRVRTAAVDKPSKFARELPPELDEVVLKALSKVPSERFASANGLLKALGVALRNTSLVASHAEVGEFVRRVASLTLAERRAVMQLQQTGSLGPISPRYPSASEIPVVVTETGITLNTSSTKIEKAPARARARASLRYVAYGALAVLAMLGAIRLTSMPKEEPARAAASQAAGPASTAITTSAQSEAPAAVPSSIAPSANAKAAVVETSSPAPKSQPARATNTNTAKAPRTSPSPAPVPEVAPTPAPSAHPVVAAPAAVPVAARDAGASSILISPPTKAPDNPY